MKNAKVEELMLKSLKLLLAQPLSTTSQFKLSSISNRSSVKSFFVPTFHSSKNFSISKEKKVFLRFKTSKSLRVYSQKIFLSLINLMGGNREKVNEKNYLNRC